MLTWSLFNQITRTSQLRSDRTASERRINLRVPLRATAHVHRVHQGRLSDGLHVRTRDISRSGISFINGGKATIEADFVLRLQPSIGQAVWIWCGLRRRTEFDRTCTINSAEFLKVLLPGQELRPGQDPSRLAWLDVEGKAGAEETPAKRSA